MVRPSKFEISKRVKGPKVTMSLKGELDMRTVGELSECPEERLRGGAPNPTLDVIRATGADRALRFVETARP